MTPTVGYCTQSHCCQHGCTDIAVRVPFSVPLCICPEGSCPLAFLNYRLNDSVARKSQDGQVICWMFATSLMTQLKPSHLKRERGMCLLAGSQKSHLRTYFQTHLVSGVTTYALQVCVSRNCTQPRATILLGAFNAHSTAASNDFNTEKLIPLHRRYILSHNPVP